MIVAHDCGPGAPPYAPARRVSFSELLGAWDSFIGRGVWVLNLHARARASRVRERVMELLGGLASDGGQWVKLARFGANTDAAVQEDERAWFAWRKEPEVGAEEIGIEPLRANAELSASVGWALIHGDEALGGVVEKQVVSAGLFVGENVQNVEVHGVRGAVFRKEDLDRIAVPGGLYHVDEAECIAEGDDHDLWRRWEGRRRWHVRNISAQ